MARTSARSNKFTKMSLSTQITQIDVFKMANTLFRPVAKYPRFKNTTESAAKRKHLKPIISPSPVAIFVLHTEF